MRREKWLRENERRLRSQKQKRDKRKQNVNSSPGLCVCPAIEGDDEGSVVDGNEEGMKTTSGYRAQFGSDGLAFAACRIGGCGAGRPYAVATFF
jgi:hypothetical protein